MEERDQTIGFRVTLKERQRLEEEAKQAGLSLTDHVRARLLSPTRSDGNGNLETLIKYAIYAISQTQNALYSIAEAHGKAGRFLSTAELEQVAHRCHDEAIQYAIEFAENFTATQAEIAAASKQQEA
jgi:hypothetical protein